MKTLIAAVMITVLLLPVGAAHADSVDDNYLALLASHGVEGPADQLIAAGHRTCDDDGQSLWGFGISPYGFAMIMLDNELATQGYSPHDISQLVLVGVSRQAVAAGLAVPASVPRHRTPDRPRRAAD